MNGKPIRDEKILVTGVTGQIGFVVGCQLAESNEVWGLARYSDPIAQDRIRQTGITPYACSLPEGDLAALPRDFTYVLHLVAQQGEGLDSDAALRVNAESTGVILAHCADARAALVMSTAGVYRNSDDPLHPYREDDRLGDAGLPRLPDYSISKIASEAVARTAARVFDLPVTIARMNAAYGPNGGLPAYHLDLIVEQRPLVAMWDAYSPIHEHDICRQVPALLGAAAVPATIVNWGGDEVGLASEWCPFLAELAGVELDFRVRAPIPGGRNGAVMDPTRRREITGPCEVQWQDGMRQMFLERFPDGVIGGLRGATSLRSALVSYQESALVAAPTNEHNDHEEDQ